MTVDQMAAALGLNRYAIKRGLGYLRDDGLIDYRVDMSNRKKRTPPVTKKRGNAN